MKTLTKYLKKRETAIDFLLRKPCKKYTPNTFHKLRVEIKKLNSAFDLINFCDTNFKRKATFKPFKLIFRKAGKVRELQIEHSILKNYSANKVIRDYRKSLKKLQLKAEKDFFSSINKKILNQITQKHRSTIVHLCEIDKKKWNTYLEKKQNHIQELIGQEILQNTQIHKLRKELKILNYNRSITNKKKQDGKLLKQDVLPELLGKWHDCQIIIKHLEKAQKRKKLSLDEADQLKIIQSKIAIESNSFFDEIKKGITA